jgi:DNA polymerase III psi subunit
MSFENIQLPPFLIQDLYKNVLIDLKDSQASDDSLRNPNILFLGKNEKNILILVNEEKIPFLEDGDLNFLIGILGACKLSMADVALVNFHQHKKLSSQALNESFSPSKNILFGVTPAAIELPLHFPHYQVQQYNNRSYLGAPSLKELAADKQLKMQLWESLKKLFSLI